MLLAAVLGASQTAGISFGTAFNNAVSIPTVLSESIVGIICGWLIGVTHREAATRIGPMLVVLLSTSLLICFQGGALVGQDLNRPDTISAFLGSRTGFVLLAVFTGLFSGLGVLISDRWPGPKLADVAPADTADIQMRSSDKKGLSGKLLHQIERGTALIGPVTDLIRELFSRLYWLGALIVLMEVQSMGTQFLILVGSYQRIGNYPPNTYIIISSTEFGLSLIGLALVGVLFVRRGK